jgi:formyltetrahydrofolate-dependent phosphoribosylglycinamide formyltransferase
MAEEQMRIAVLVSGNGTNLQALLDAQAQDALAPGVIVLVISNRPGVKALERAHAAQLPSLVIDHKAYDDRASFEDALLAALEAHQVEAVVLAGFMRILSAHFVDRFEHRILNTHPALCPAFPGVNAPQQAVDAGVKVTGCTVHFVDRGVDTGPILLQEAIAVLDDDTAESLHQRIQVLEHRLLPRATQLLAAGRVHCDESGRVRIR